MTAWQLVSDDGQLVSDDGQLVSDDGQLVTGSGAGMPTEGRTRGGPAAAVLVVVMVRN